MPAVVIIICLKIASSTGSHFFHASVRVLIQLGEKPPHGAEILLFPGRKNGDAAASREFLSLYPRKILKMWLGNPWTQWRPIQKIMHVNLGYPIAMFDYRRVCSTWSDEKNNQKVSDHVPKTMAVLRNLFFAGRFYMKVLILIIRSRMEHWEKHLGMGQNPVPLVNIKTADKWICMDMHLFKYGSMDFDP